MLLQNVDRSELQQILIQLDQALYNHQQWHNDLIRTMACRLPSDKHDIMAEAHKECRFGQWYYSSSSKNINAHPGFVAIGKAHKRMHQLASTVLLNLNATGAITSLDYDNFANSLERLRLEIYALKNELEILLYNRDPLTMTINRVTMLPMLREQQELMRRQAQPSCVVMVDIDHFKKINDEYGHLVGDKVLSILARFLIENLRPYDKVFRYGGEEFLISVQQLNVEQAYELIDRLRVNIDKLEIDVGIGKKLHITISCGLTNLDPDTTVEESIDHADKALYAAKSSGRNVTKYWEDSME